MEPRVVFMNRKQIQARVKIYLMLGMIILCFFGNKTRETSDGLESPISLTSSDGAGLILSSYESNTVLDGIFAFTEIKLTFHNPESRQREGRFRISLPEGAHLARFAMMIGDKWQEGEVVERKKAIRVYEDFLHRKQDPALLESDAGNEFSARIFPIPPNADKKIVLSYSTTLDSFPPKHTIPLLGLPKIEDFKLRVMFEPEEFQSKSIREMDATEATAQSRKVFSINKKNFKPNSDFTFEHKTKQNTYIQHNNDFVINMVPFVERSNEQKDFDRLVVLVDTSASSTLHFQNTVSKLEKVLDQLLLKESFIFGFDTQLTTYGVGKEGLKKIRLTQPLGASNLSGALESLSKVIGDRSYRLLIVSDCIPTFGTVEPKNIGLLLKQYTWMLRTDVLVPSTYQDSGVISVLLSSGKENGISIPMQRTEEEIQRRLRLPVLSMPSIEIKGSEWIFTKGESVLQSGDSITIFGQKNNALLKEPVQLYVSGKEIKNLIEQKVEPILLHREVTAARMTRLLDIANYEKNADIANGIRLQVTELSIENRIQCALTSFLVLETAEDYDRFQITRFKLTDIMTVGLDGIEVLNRKTDKSYEFLSEQSVQKRKLEEAERQQKLEEARRRRQKDKMARPESDLVKKSESRTDTDEEETENRPAPAPKIESGDSNQETSPEAVTQKPTEVNPQANDVPKRNQFQVQSVALDGSTNIEIPKRTPIEPHTGNLKKFYVYLNAGENLKSLEFAEAWRKNSPDDVLALLALGDSYFALGDRKNAIRAFTSFVDYFPMRADIRRWAGEKLMAMNAWNESIDTLEKALSQRPDHPSTYHLLGIAYLKNKEYKKAFEVLYGGLNTKFASRFLNAYDILYDDLDLVYTLTKQDQKESQKLQLGELEKLNLKILDPEVRFVLVWETDANDVDFHIYDKKGNHAFYSQKKLASGGELYADITDGYGPECFRIIKPKAFPYKLEAHYYSRGPMGYGMGALQVIRLNKDLKLELEIRNFVIMNDGAYIDLGIVK